MLKTIAETIGYASLAISFLIFAALLSGLPVWILWNWLMPTLFGLSEISFLQAIGLSLLSSLLFKSSSSSSSK